MRIKEKQPVPVSAVAKHHIDHQGGFAHAWLAKNVEPTTPFNIANAK
jgi:hypothetical protein